MKKKNYFAAATGVGIAGLIILISGVFNEDDSVNIGCYIFSFLICYATCGFLFLQGKACNDDDNFRSW